MNVEPESAPTRRPANVAEGAFWEQMTIAGWTVSKRGWPDYFMWKDGRIAAVEVKPSPLKDLSRHQWRVAKVLAAHGIPVYRWDPITGLKRIDANGRISPG